MLLGWVVLLDLAYTMNMEEENVTGEEKEIAETCVEQKVQISKETPKEMKTEIQKDSVRVLLMDSQYQSYYHPKVTLWWQGQEYVFDAENGTEEELSCVFEGGTQGIKVTSVERTQGNPVYTGKLKIVKKPQGFLLINTVPLEDYLEGVVPSEMPASYPEEALKAQAVCARTYAWKQIQEKTLEKYGADVDDSVNYQVYNNIEKQEASSKAVQDTKGKVLCQNGEPIEAYYFSTSAGATSTDEIWGAESAAPYLKSVECTFDSEEPWRIWKTEISWDVIEKRAQQIEGCAGSLAGIEIVKKNESGAVTGLRVYTEGGETEISNEYAIRKFLAPDQSVLMGKEEKRTETGKLLPSAYFSLETKEGECFVVKGGGYGHGVGMSQTAAREMAEEGYKWEEILQYFFKNIEICQG